jgi:hypothetical protein
MRRAAIFLALAMLVGACGAPSSVSKQAEALASTAAEGALLAEEVADGRSTGAFAKTHARALLEQAEEVRAASASPEVGSLAGEIVSALRQLASLPTDRVVASEAEERLEAAAEEAEEIEESAP